MIVSNKPPCCMIHAFQSFLKQKLLNFAAVCMLFLPSIALTQDLGLIADNIYADDAGNLIAEGDVRVHDGGRTLSASRLTYNQNSGQISLEGPILITDADGNSIHAESAELDDTFRNGIIEGAKLILQDELQIVGERIERSDGRFARLQRVAASSCEICDNSIGPIWQIRAREVVHDEEKKRLYFADARILIFDVPIFWAPRLSLPDPSVDRASGFLFPSLRSNSIVGTGVKIPYFITLGDHADLTLSPFVSDVSRTVEYRYRQAFTYGDLEINGAISDDDTDQDGLRSYFFLEGNYELPREFHLDFDVELASDESYLSDYNFSGKDRLDSEIRLWRVQRDQLIDARVTYFETYRENENQLTIPSLVGSASWLQRMHSSLIPGEFTLGLDASVIQRRSGENILGRDVSRLSTELRWQNRAVFGPGIWVKPEVGFSLDAFETQQDDTFPATDISANPELALEFRWPLARLNRGGARELLEPVLQFAWSGTDRAEVANEESRRATLDEGNLFAISRFPAEDRREQGFRAAQGLRWQSITPSGGNAQFTLGHVWRNREDDAFTLSSGLSRGNQSWLLAGGIRGSNGLNLFGRAVSDQDMELRKAEARIDWEHARGLLEGSYVWLGKDADEGRSEQVSEISLSGEQQLSRHWRAGLDWRYDLIAEETVRVDGEMIFQNECIDISFTASRRFSTSDIVDPSIDFGVSVSLIGFGTTGNREGMRSKCS